MYIKDVAMEVGGINVYKHVLVGVAGNCEVLRLEVAVVGWGVRGGGMAGVRGCLGEPGFNATCSIGCFAGKDDELICGVFGGGRGSGFLKGNDVCFKWSE